MTPPQSPWTHPRWSYDEVIKDKPDEIDVLRLKDGVALRFLCKTPDPGRREWTALIEVLLTPEQAIELLNKMLEGGTYGNPTEKEIEEVRADGKEETQAEEAGDHIAPHTQAG